MSCQFLLSVLTLHFCFTLFPVLHAFLIFFKLPILKYIFVFFFVAVVFSANLVEADRKYLVNGLLLSQEGGTGTREGYSIKFYTRRLRPEVQTLTI